MNGDQERYAEKIAKLLEKAQSTTEAEAEVLMDKAQELMTKYAVSNMMIDEHRGKVREELLQESIKYRGIYSKTLMMLGNYLSMRNNCKAVYFGERRDDVGKYQDLHIHGFESDVRNVIMLDTSLQLQCMTALNRWWKTYDRATFLSGMQRYKDKRQFVSSFTYAVNERLMEAVRRAEQEAATEHAAATSVTPEEAVSSVALVIRSRRDTVNDWVDRKYGRLRTTRSRTHSGSGSASGAGREAGSRADLGGGKLGGSRRQLNG